MFRIFLVRHGETEWNVERRLQGHLDSPLTDRGRRQALHNGGHLEQLLDGSRVRMVTSPLGRCLATASLIAGRIGHDEDRIERDDRLKELGHGDWEGLTFDDIRDTEHFRRRQADRWTIPTPGGESYDDVAARVGSWLREIGTGTIVAVSHGCAGRILRCIHGNLARDSVFTMDEHHEDIYLLGPGGRVERV